MTIKLILASALSLTLVSYTINTKKIKSPITANAIQATGKEIFLLNCASCHHATRDLTGPTIYDVRKRWKSKTLLYKYVRNAAEVQKTDPYAKALFNKWNKTVMTPFPKLTNAEIDLIFDYVDGEAKKKGLL